MNWLKRLFKKKAQAPVVVQWWWSCVDCEHSGIGSEFQAREDSTNHLIKFGHSITGGVS